MEEATEPQKHKKKKKKSTQPEESQVTSEDSKAIPQSRWRKSPRTRNPSRS